jgi:hypothetical protein
MAKDGAMQIANGRSSIIKEVEKAKEFDFPSFFAVLQSRPCQ